MLKTLASSTLVMMALSGQAFADITAPIAPLSSHYIVTRLDMRKCAYPICGGYFVKAVNQARTRCADGSLQNECHATLLDTKALGWSEEDRGQFDPSWIRGQALVKGTLRAVAGPWPQKADTLVISEAWVAQAQSKPTGLFANFKNSGIVCITAPCPTITETTLNYPLKHNIAGLDLAASGATPDQVEAGQQQTLRRAGLVAVGQHANVSGPAGKSQEFIASEFYLPFAPKPTR